MESIKQIQKAGSGAAVTQIGIVNCGIDEKRAREICDEKINDAIRDLTEEACNKAVQRVYDFISVFLKKVSERQVDLSAFAEPSFQRELAKAQKFSAASDRENDFEMLSELLLERMNGKLKRKTKTGISRALEVVTEIDDDELLGLTIVYLGLSLSPASSLSETSHWGLGVLERVFAKFPLSDLSKTNSWVENLNMLDAIILNPFDRFSKFADLLATKLNGYVCVGIGEGTQEFEKAKQLLRNAGISESLLVKNEFLQGYYRLPVVNTSDFGSLSVEMAILNPENGTQTNTWVPIPTAMTQVMSEVFALYDKNAKLLFEVKKRFMDQLNSYPALSLVQKWFDSLNTSFSVTKVGKALAYVNGRRYAPELPMPPLE